MFAERLNILMELTGTTASALGKACALDSSHVSRLRRGSRPLPQNPTFLPAMSGYFSRRIKSDYQKTSLTKIMRLERWPTEDNHAAALITLWLSGKENYAPVEPIIRNLTTAPAMPKYCPPAGYAASADEFLLDNYYGSEGKRAALTQLFAMISKEKTPQTMLLFSDEEMGWLYDDPNFALFWGQECVRILANGNRVRIIHAVHRGIHEMLEGVAKWLPLYMTGSVEPYYYPKLRDDLFQRTLFIAPLTAAISSVSVDRKTDSMLNTFYTDPKAISALTSEYKNLLTLCRPLMQITNAHNSDDFWDSYAAFLKAGGKMICLGSIPTLSTMPLEVAQAMQTRAPESSILKTRKALSEALNEYLELGHNNEQYKDNRYLDLLVKQKGGTDIIPLPFADLLGAPGLYYTAEEYKSHLANLDELATQYSNYSSKKIAQTPLNLSLYGKESKGIFLCKNDAPSIIFAFDEPHMTNAFWDYLARLAD